MVRNITVKIFAYHSFSDDHIGVCARLHGDAHL